jgi:hypothetical protein
MAVRRYNMSRFQKVKLCPGIGAGQWRMKPQLQMAVPGYPA